MAKNKVLGVKVTMEEYGIVCQRVGKLGTDCSKYLYTLLFPKTDTTLAKGGNIEETTKETNALKNKIKELEEKLKAVPVTNNKEADELKLRLEKQKEDRKKWIAKEEKTITLLGKLREIDLKLQILVNKVQDSETKQEFKKLSKQSYLIIQEVIKINSKDHTNNDKK